MRILIAGQTFYKKNNGQAVFTINLAEGLARCGHEVLIVVPSERGRAYRKRHQGLTIQAVPALSIGHNVNITAFSDGLVERTMAEFQPDVVHIQDHYFLCRSVRHAARKCRKLIIGTNHFLPDNLTYNLRVPAWAREITHRFMWDNMLAVFNTLHAVTTPTETAAKILRRRQIAVPVQAISCGLDQSRFYPRPELDRAALRRRYGLDPEKVLFLYVGRVDREKELDVMVRALNILKRDDIQLAIVGRGSYLKALRTLVRELALRGRVIFPGYIPDDDLPLLLNSADVFVMPSRAELQSIATLEAMSSGLPVLAANARALPELVSHNVNGYLFEVGNLVEAAHGLAAMADRRDQWVKMGAVSLLKAHPHSLRNTIRQYESLYQDLLLYPARVLSNRKERSVSVLKRVVP